jgi:hypothetical protein
VHQAGNANRLKRSQTGVHLRAMGAPGVIVKYTPDRAVPLENKMSRRSGRERIDWANSSWVLDNKRLPIL